LIVLSIRNEVDYLAGKDQRSSQVSKELKVADTTMKSAQDDVASSSAASSCSRPQVTSRLAQPADIPAVAALVVTSFRRDPLVHRLLAPLARDPSLAVDTIYFWSRRLAIYLLDPDVRFTVASVPSTWAAERERQLRGERQSKCNASPSAQSTPADGAGATGAQPETIGPVSPDELWQALDWLRDHDALGEDVDGQRIAGFAVWRVEAGGRAWKGQRKQGWWAWARCGSPSLQNMP
jgi:hypothetical protein